MKTFFHPPGISKFLSGRDKWEATQTSAQRPRQSFSAQRLTLTNACARSVTWNLALAAVVLLYACVELCKTCYCRPQVEGEKSRSCHPSCPGKHSPRAVCMGGKLQWPVLLLLPGEAARRPAVSWVVSPILRVTCHGGCVVREQGKESALV